MYAAPKYFGCFKDKVPEIPAKQYCTGRLFIEDVEYPGACSTYPYIRTGNAISYTFKGYWGDGAVEEFEVKKLAGQNLTLQWGFNFCRWWLKTKLQGEADNFLLKPGSRSFVAMGGRADDRANL